MLKRVPTRQCICCRTKGEKNSFLRVIRTKDGEYRLDLTGKMNGRGAYICKNDECMEKLEKTKALDRVFRSHIPHEVYVRVLEEYNEFEK